MKEAIIPYVTQIAAEDTARWPIIAPGVTPVEERIPIEPTMPDYPCGWKQFVNFATGRCRNVTLMQKAWRAGLIAQDVQMRREREAGLEVVNPPEDIADLELILSFFRSTEAGEYVRGPAIPGLRKTAWNSWAGAVEKAFESDSSSMRYLVRPWEDDIHPKLLPSVIAKDASGIGNARDAVNKLEERYQKNTTPNPQLHFWAGVF